MWLAGKDIHGSTVGIVGMGRIGQVFARRLQGFDCKKVQYHNRTRLDRSQEDALGVEYVSSIDELLESSDFVIPHCPLTPGTRHMFGSKEFAKVSEC